MINHISVAIITKNAAATLPETLNSLTEFTDVVIYDNGSEDNTAEIARQYSNVSLHTGSFDGFGPTKNKAVALAKNDWILSLDADETVSTTLLETLKNWATNTPQRAGLVLRDNYFMGKAVRCGSWGNDWLIRLFNRQCHSFNQANVHESVQLTKAAEVVKLKGTIDHNAVQQLGQFLQKVDRYSEIHHQQIVAQNKTLPPSIIFLKTLFAFWRSYLLQRGFLAGWRGLVIAWSNANGVFFKYMKAHAALHADKIHAATTLPADKNQGAKDDSRT